MATRKSLDHQPGTIPEIRSDGESVTFRLEVPGEAENTRLVIRCDSNGEVWATIEAAGAIHRGRR
jgi:hypothetical protein